MTSSTGVCQVIYRCGVLALLVELLLLTVWILCENAESNTRFDLMKNVNSTVFVIVTAVAGSTSSLANASIGLAPKKAATLDMFPYLTNLPVLRGSDTLITPRPFRWAPIDPDQVPFQFSTEELEALDGKWDAMSLTSTCAIGAISAGAEQRYIQSQAEEHTGCYTKELSDDTWNQPQHVQNYMAKFVPSLDSEGTERTYLFGVQDIVELLPDNSDIVVIGDSVSHQYFGAMTCSLARESEPHQFTEYQSYRRKKLDWRIGTGIRKEISFRTQNNHSVKVVLHAEYVFAQNGNTIREACSGRTKVLVVNFGLHWNQFGPYEKDIKVLLKYLKQHCMERGVQVIFRGTTTQHFMQFGGNYAGRIRRTKEYAEKLGLKPSDVEYLVNTTKPQIGCTKVLYESQSQLNRLYDWRNRLATKLFSENGFDVVPTPWGRQSTGCVDKTSVKNTIFYIPFGEVTFDQYDKHDLECTHYCYSPQLWQPLHDAIYLAMRQTSPGICSQALDVHKAVPRPTSPRLPRENETNDCHFQIDPSLFEGIYNKEFCLSAANHTPAAS